jgi:hypothetical protein
MRGSNAAERFAGLGDDRVRAHRVALEERLRLFIS